MSQTPTEELRLRATEEQMRRALGLRQGSSSSARFSSSGTHAPHPQKRQFVRDGDVPVEILHGHDNSSRVNQLAATREALQAQTAAREEAERLLTEARHTIHDLETKLGHERLAKDEATQRTNAARLQIEEALTAAQEELAVERALRARAERERDEAAVARQTAEQRLRQTTAPSKIRAGSALPSGDTAQRRRGRPPKVAREVTPDPQTSWNGGRPGGKTSIGSHAFVLPIRAEEEQMFTVTEVLLTVGVKFHAYPKWAAGNVYQPVDRHLQEPRTISGMG